MSSISLIVSLPRECTVLGRGEGGESRKEGRGRRLKTSRGFPPPPPSPPLACNERWSHFRFLCLFTAAKRSWRDTKEVGHGSRRRRLARWTRKKAEPSVAASERSVSLRILPLFPRSRANVNTLPCAWMRFPFFVRRLSFFEKWRRRFKREKKIIKDSKRSEISLMFRFPSSLLAGRMKL